MWRTEKKGLKKFSKKQCFHKIKRLKIRNNLADYQFREKKIKDYLM